MNDLSFLIRAVGRVESPLADPALAPKQGDEGAPDAWLVFDSAVVEALDGLRVGEEVILLTWLDRANREVLCVHPRGESSRRVQGVFQYALARSAESDRHTSGGNHGDRRRTSQGATPRSRRRDADHRREAGTRGRSERAVRVGCGCERRSRSSSRLRYGSTVSDGDWTMISGGGALSSLERPRLLSVDETLDALRTAQQTSISRPARRDSPAAELESPLQTTAAIGQCAPPLTERRPVVPRRPHLSPIAPLAYSS